MHRPRPPKTKVSLGQWIKSHKLPTITLGSVVALVGLGVGYINTGADALRADIYQPLYQEIGIMDTAIHNNNMQTNYSSDVHQLLNRNGNIGRIPKALRRKIARLYEAEGEARAHIIPVAHKISEMMPGEIRKIRSEADDEAWFEKTVSQLNAESNLNTGSFPYMSVPFNHTGISPSLDLRDKAHPRIGSLGTVTWVVNDWMNFPNSSSQLSTVAWPTTWFLGFDERNESWYYRITRDDLTRNRLTLEQFLRPTYEKLASDPDFQQLIHSNQTAVGLLDDVKASLEGRVQQPKQLLDLIDFF